MSNVTSRDLGLDAFLRELREASVNEVVVGVAEGSVNADGATIAEYAAANEFGTSKIPERSFMRTAFDEDAARIVDEAGGNSRPTDVIAVFRGIGLRMEASIKRKIGSNIQPANHPETIKKKGSSRTLIDTSAMINSVRYIIRRVR